MSGYPTKQIDGDVSVGRHVSLGGTATVRGNVTVGHNLRVEGWLEAKNIKGPGKGLYKTVAALRAAYPLPHDGWWALVMVSGQSDHLGQLYLADGGVWVAQVDGSGNPLLKGNPTVDDTECKESIVELTGDLEAVKNQVTQHTADIASMRTTQTTQGNTLATLSGEMATMQQGLSTVTGDLSTLSKQVTQHTADIASMRTAQTTQEQALTVLSGKVGTVEQGLATLSKQVTQHTTDIGNLQTVQTTQENTLTAQRGRIDTLSTGQQQLRKSLDALTDSVGEADGIAPLDADGKIPAAYLPEGLDCVLELGGTVSGVTAQQASSSNLSTDAGCSVVWSTDTGTLVLMVRSGATLSYYMNWADGDRYGTAGTQGRTPLRGKLYLDTTTRQAYHWDGSTLQVVGDFAPLGDDGHIPSSYLPTGMDDVLELGGTVSGVTAQQASSSKPSTEAGCSVVWDTVSKTLLLAVQDTLRPVATYYTNWLDGDRYGTASAQGRMALRGKLYLDTSTHKAYYWTGSVMQSIGADSGTGSSDTPQPYTYSVDNMADVVVLTASGTLKAPLVQTDADGGRVWQLHSSIQVRRGQTLLMETTGSAGTGKYSLTAVCDGCTSHFERSTLYIDTVACDGRTSASVEVTIDCEGKAALTFVYHIKLVREGGEYVPQTVAVRGRVTLSQGGDGVFHDYADGDTAQAGTGAVVLYSGAATVVLPDSAAVGDRYVFMPVDTASRLTLEGVVEDASGPVMAVWYGGKWVCGAF